MPEQPPTDADAVAERQLGLDGPVVGLASLCPDCNGDRALTVARAWGLQGPLQCPNHALQSASIGFRFGEIVETLLPQSSTGPSGGGSSGAEGASDTMSYTWDLTRGSGYHAKLSKVRHQVATEKRVAEMNWTLYQEFLREDLNYGPSTSAQRIMNLKRIAGLSDDPRGTHVDVHVELTGPVDGIIGSFREYYKARKRAGCKAGALKNDHRAFSPYVRFLGIPAREVMPVSVNLGVKPKGLLQSPEEVFQLLHHDYGYGSRADRSYEVALIRHLLAFDFGFGIRFPSEAHVLQLEWYDPENHLLRIVEPKKHFSERILPITPQWLCCGRSVPSLLNYVQYWRPKVDPDWKQGAFFLLPTGEPFATKEYLRKWVNDRVKPHFPWYHGYLGRTWAINARLVDYRLNSGDRDWMGVARFVGHSSVQTLRTYYDQFVDVQEKFHGTNWMNRAFIKGSRNGRNGVAEPTPPKPGGVRQFVERKQGRARGEAQEFTSEKRLTEPRFLRGVRHGMNPDRGG